MDGVVHTLLPSTCTADTVCRFVALMLRLVVSTWSQRQRRSERLWRAGKTLVAAAAPDDFIDTTIVEEGESYVGVDFERQELRVIFETMDKNNIFYKMLTVDQIVSTFRTLEALPRTISFYEHSCSIALRTAVV